MKKSFGFILSALIIFGFIGCGETSIYGTWGYEDKGVRYEMRFYNEFREDKYTSFRDGGRTGGGTFSIKDDKITLTRTDGNYDVSEFADMSYLGIRSGLRNHKKDEFIEKLRSSRLNEDTIEFLIGNYFPIYTYQYRLTRNTLSLTNTEFPLSDIQTYKKMKATK